MATYLEMLIKNFKDIISGGYNGKELNMRNNEKLRKLPHTTDFPDYHPHCTITYLLPGTSDKYIELLKGVSIQVKPTEFVYSKTNGEKIKNKI